MYANKEEELKAVRLKTVKIQFLGLPGAILIGLALYGIFAANGNAFHPALNDKTTVYALLAIGIVIELWQFFMLIPLWKKQMQLRNK